MILLRALSKFENHSQREIARILGVSRNTVRDIFDAQDAADAYWNVVCDLTESQIEELLFPKAELMLLLNNRIMPMCIKSF